MAERRMFSKTIIDSDAFLDMPQSSQLLYFHLAMRADDDGFINNPKSIMRNVKCNDDDLKLLIVKKFLIPFESGVVVIKHWRIHNYIRNDRYKETKYKEEKASLGLDENNAYTQSENCLVDKMDTNGIPVVYQTDTQVRLGKDRLEIELGEDSLELGKDNTPPLSPSQGDESTKDQKKKETAEEMFERVLADYNISDYLLEAVRDWIKYKKERKFTYQEVGLTRTLSQISKYAREYGDEAVYNVISDSIASGYQGIMFDRLKKSNRTGRSLVDEWRNA